MTTRLRPRFVCEGMGMEAPLATAAQCVHASAFFAADRASSSAVSLTRNFLWLSSPMSSVAGGDLGTMWW